MGQFAYAVDATAGDCYARKARATILQFARRSLALYRPDTPCSTLGRVVPGEWLGDPELVVVWDGTNAPDPDGWGHTHGLLLAREVDG